MSASNKGNEKAEDSHISVQRSDGLRHDLLSVFTNKSSGASPLQNIVEEAQNESKKADQHSDSPNINISRSDGIHHDIVKVYKAGSTDAAPSEPTKQKRSNSLGLAELTGFIANTFNRTSITSPQKDSAYAPKTVRIVHMSDTQNFLNRLEKNSFLPHGDILVHTGDFTNGGTDDEFELFNQWLASVSGRYLYRIICLGNRDVKVYGSNFEVMKKKLSNATHVLCHEEAVVLGIRFYGCPWHWQHKSNYDPRPGAPATINARFDQIPVGTQVLLTHGPAYGKLDSNTAGETSEHWGSRDLAEAVRRVKPGVHLHGHVKDSRGILLPFGNTPLTVNACMADKNLTVLYAAPTVIKAVQIMDMTPSTGSSAPAASNWIFALDSLE